MCVWYNAFKQSETDSSLREREREVGRNGPGQETDPCFGRRLYLDLQGMEHVKSVKVTVWGEGGGDCGKKICLHT